MLISACLCWPCPRRDSISASWLPRRLRRRCRSALPRGSQCGHLRKQQIHQVVGDSLHSAAAAVPLPYLTQSEHYMPTMVSRLCWPSFTQPIAFAFSLMYRCRVFSRLFQRPSNNEALTSLPIYTHNNRSNLTEKHEAQRVSVKQPNNKAAVVKGICNVFYWLRASERSERSEFFRI